MALLVPFVFICCVPFVFICVFNWPSLEPKTNVLLIIANSGLTKVKTVGMEEVDVVAVEGS